MELRISGVLDAGESRISGVLDIEELEIPDVPDTGICFFTVF